MLPQWPEPRGITPRPWAYFQKPKSNQIPKERINECEPVQFHLVAPDCANPG
jgi:hypothetical protein